MAKLKVKEVIMVNVLNLRILHCSFIQHPMVHVFIKYAFVLISNTFSVGCGVTRGNDPVSGDDDDGGVVIV